MPNLRNEVQGHLVWAWGRYQDDRRTQGLMAPNDEAIIPFLNLRWIQMQNVRCIFSIRDITVQVFRCVGLWAFVQLDLALSW